MKKLVSLGLIAGALFAKEVTTIVPYYAVLDYGNKSSKDNGNIKGIYFSNGTLNYLFEFAYSKTDIKYKNSATPNLIQDEITAIYSNYFVNKSFKIGIHSNSTTDTDLQNGNTLIFGASGWKWLGYYSKLTFGADFYTSYYANGKDLKYKTAKVRVNQISPFISYYKAYKSFLNTITFKLNYEKISAYDESLTSYELKDNFAKGKFYAEAEIFTGKMRTGIKDNGFTVYNSKDKYKNSYKIKAGYYLKSNLKADISYTYNKFDEFGNQKDTTNSVIVATVSYSF